MVLFAALLGAGLCRVSLAQAAPQYTVTDLGDLGGGVSYAFAINASGEVVGRSKVDLTHFHAFTYASGMLTDLGTLSGGTSSGASGINAAGDVVGASTGLATSGDGTTYQINHAFLYHSGEMQDLTPDLSADSSSAAIGINDGGQFSGYARQGRTYPFVSGGGVVQYIDIDAIGGTDCEVGPINGAGQCFVNAWGHSYNRSFICDGTSVVCMGDVGVAGNFPECIGINDLGAVVGFAVPTHTAFLYSDGAYQDLGALLPGVASEAAGVNNGGDVAGYFYPSGGGPAHGFIYTQGVIRDLNDLVPPGSGWQIAFASAINDNGQIAGYGISPAGLNHAFLLTPVAPCPAPTIQSGPASVSTCSAGPAVVSVQAAGMGDLGFEWYVQDESAPDGWSLLSDGPVLRSGATVFVVAGSSTSAMTISNVGGMILESLGSSSPRVRCVVHDACGSVTSGPATITVNSADFNHDGDLGTDADIAAFFACLGGDCCATCGSADFNGDGDLGTDSDIEAFFRVLGGGNC